MLPGEESGFAVGLDGSLFEGGDVGVEVFDRRGGDGDQAGVAQDAVASGEDGFLLEDVVVFGGLEASSICPILARWAWSERMGVFLYRLSTPRVGLLGV